MTRLAAALLLLAIATACSSGQDPGLNPSTSAGPTTTSRTLSECPTDGSGVTAPPEGCLDEDGIVVRP